MTIKTPGNCDPELNPDECRYVGHGLACPRRDDIFPTLHCEYLVWESKRCKVCGDTGYVINCESGLFDAFGHNPTMITTPCPHCLDMERKAASKVTK